MMRRLPNYNPAEHMPRLEDAFLTRREMLQRTGMGMGALSLATMMGGGLFPSVASGFEATASGARPASGTVRSPLSPKQPHFAAKAKHVIHIFAGGGPSHVDTFDPKPSLAQFEAKTLPGLNGVAYPSPFEFRKYGRSGLEISEIFDRLGSHC